MIPLAGILPHDVAAVVAVARRRATQGAPKAIADEMRAAIVASEQLRTDAALDDARRLSQIGRRFARCSFDRTVVDDDNAAAHAVARACAAGGGTTGFGLFGDLGVGKSHMAACIVNALLAEGKPAAYVRVDKLLLSIRATYGAKVVETEDAIVRRYARIPMLVIDDLDRMELSDWSIRTLDTVVNARYEEELPLGVTANISLAEHMRRETRLDANPDTWVAMLDRMREMTRGPQNGSWIRMTGESRR